MKKATCPIDRAGRVLPGTMVGFVGITLGTNPEKFYSKIRDFELFFHSNLVFSP